MRESFRDKIAMNVFVLCTGRCGSVTFAKACSHFDNYSVGHESRAMHWGNARLDYPENHIEVDNRLSWFLGELMANHARDSYFVHLKRNTEETAHSFARRYPGGIIGAFSGCIVMTPKRVRDAMDVGHELDMCRYYVETVNANIKLALAFAQFRKEIAIETAKEDFPSFMKSINAIGNIEAAVAEFDKRYNASV
jgi:hypothetical protein